MLLNYFKIAWRNLLNNKVYSLINIFGLALGMAVTIMICLWIQDEINFNRSFQNHDQIAQVFQSQTLNGEVGTGPAIPRPLEFLFRESYNSNFDKLAMSSWTNSKYLKYGETNISKTGNYIQEEGLEIFEPKILKGDKNGLDEINSIMISESTAKALFGNNDPLGKILKVNSVDDMLITAVYEDFPLNTSLYDVHFLMPWEHYINSQEWIKYARDQWGNNSFQLFVKIPEDLSMETVTANILDSKKKANEEAINFDTKIFLLPMADWHLRSNFENGVQTGGRIENVWLFGIIGAFVLFLACINFMNLSTARSEKRALEVGIRKAIGSSKAQLIKQFLSESLVVTMISFIVSLGLALLFLSTFNELASKEITFPWSSPEFWIYSLVFIIITALLAGGYPALYLSSFRLGKSFKGNI
ncbi:ABC transporter permease [Antarcticibacterium sp. 1MA-6-2]|uniref:ABC transporter permease n=1 Tax=Antarcticibacterium sp. 1MA-6-2 TaxID=2908210 RepID=UPI0028832507|nr:ABC transporter permease [Antarcticibacterium sp. 1MA-6-2]